MESALERDIRRALRDISVRLPLPMGKVERAVEEAKEKIDAASSEGRIVAALPKQFQSDIRDHLKHYHAEVETLAAAQSYLAKLRQHKQSGTFPVSINSIKSPTIQFSRSFVNAPADKSMRGTYSIAPGSDACVFEWAVDIAISDLKKKVLEQWIAEKAKEVRFLETKASVASAVDELGRS